MSKKRGHHEGSIHQRSNGTWRAQITLPGGKRLSHSSTEKKECMTWLRKTQDQITRGLTYSSAQTTFGEFLTKWLENKRSSVRQKTFEQYSMVSRIHIFPALAGVRFKDLNPQRIQYIYDALRDRGVGERTIQVCHAVIHGCLEHALRIGLLSYNPASSVIVPKVEQKEMQVWSEEQVSQFLVTIQGHRNEHLFRLALATGMRQAELFALQWKDIDWIAGTFRVRRQILSPEGGGFQFIPPKTRYSNRTIELGELTLRSLRQQMAKVDLMRSLYHHNWKEYDLVFPSTHGTPQERSNITREFKSLIKQAGLPPFRFHDLRHTAASLMLNHGIPTLIVSRILGHSKPSMTLDLYGHLMPGAQTEAAQLMDELVHPIRIEL